MEQCEQDIYENGNIVGVYDGRSEDMERFVVNASKQCGIKMDWHYCGGRAVVKTMSNNILDCKYSLNMCIPIRELG